MKEILFGTIGPNETATSREPVWQTLAGCVVFWAGLLTLCWVL